MTRKGFTTNRATYKGKVYEYEYKYDPNDNRNRIGFRAKKGTTSCNWLMKFPSQRDSCAAVQDILERYLHLMLEEIEQSQFTPEEVELIWRLRPRLSKWGPDNIDLMPAMLITHAKSQKVAEELKVDLDALIKKLNEVSPGQRYALLHQMWDRGLEAKNAAG